LKIRPQFDAFLPLFRDEDTALKKIRKSVLTAENSGGRPPPR